MTWLAHIALVPALAGLAAASCAGMSDDCSSNPSPLRQFNPLNFHADTCNLKWTHGCTVLDPHGGLQQKPPPFSLCDALHRPAGLLPIDAYSLALQPNDFAPGSPPFTLHGLWPGSAGGSGGKNQPFGCLYGEEFDEEAILGNLGGLLSHFWPTNAKYNNTMQCFILSEWMKHGTCAVVPGADGTAFRLPQEAYFRTAFVLTAEFNANEALREQLRDLEPLVSTRCVQCAYLATVGWTGTDVASVPRMSADCIDQCFACGDHWDTCAPAQLDSTVLLDPGNAPLKKRSDSSSSENASFLFPLLEYAMPALASSDYMSPWQGTWRSFGAEQLGSGKFEFAQTFIDDVLTVTTDSPYPQTCIYERRGPGELVLRCGAGANHHLEDCLVQRLPDIGRLEVAFLACNHTGAPTPASFYAAMDTSGCGNFLMFRCKASATGCAFSPEGVSAAGSTASEPETETETMSNSEPSPVSHSQPGVAGAPPALLGSWRSIQVSSHYQEGLARWNFTADGQASLQWPNYPGRGVQRYSVSHSDDDASLVLLAGASGTVITCRFQFQYEPVYSYAVLDCGADQETTQWAMGRCNPCSAHCRYSCGPENYFCGAGSCDPANSAQAAAASAGALPSPPRHAHTAHAPKDGGHDWCTPQDSHCWPTKTAIRKLEQALDPAVPRLGLRWSSYPQPQPAPVPTGSINNQSFYGLGDAPAGLRALPAAGAGAWNRASDMCKAALHQNEYRDWNPFIVVFPLNERHVAAALTFAARHRLCIATAGTGHEYNSRNSCPTGGLLIRTILLKDKSFLPTWGEDPALAPAGAFRFGAGAVFAEMHAFSAEHDRAVASGWCSTVGMVGFHLGGGHGPFAPSMGLGVDNVLEIEVLQLGRDDAYGQPVVHKKTASRRRNPQLFWAMLGGGGGVWGVVLSMTIRAHAVPSGGLSHVLVPQGGTFCPDPASPYGYQWLRAMWPRFAAWQLTLNHKVSTQPGFFINTTQYATGGLCAVTWQFNIEYFYAGGQSEPNYLLFRDRLLHDVLQAPATTTAQERNFASAYEYVLSMPPDKFLLAVTNPLPGPPSDSATGSQNSVLVSRQAMEARFASTMMDVLDICVASLASPDPTSPDPSGHRCGFHYLYTSLTGNLGSARPGDTAISPGFRSALMLWNARTLTTRQAMDTVYRLGPNSYFSESSYVMHNWTDRYWGRKGYEQLLAVKRAHDPGNYFWCHHCVGDDPDDAYGEPLGAAAGFVGEGDELQSQLRVG
ncbi:hypothetical protein N658DRAFT_521175 [Parathielavia hyrcaniae]|uniref:FAD-binding PCMH-type domain-containing protein n=1 Tax=Parathielavia hyrcaniae TaxID=113614 RepID=A0AAN6Q6J5_9PEZI|nr:hypothetical protein N658DRAFT_521175 [Parathielavia hyrcaniae]